MGSESVFLLRHKIKALNEKITELNVKIEQDYHERAELLKTIKELKQEPKVEYPVEIDTSLQEIFNEINEVLDNLSPDIQKRFIYLLKSNIKMMANIAKGNFNPFNLFKQFMS